MSLRRLHGWNLTPKEVGEWYSRVAVAAAKAGAGSDAMRIWIRVANLSPSRLEGLEDLVGAGLRDELIDFYRKMGKRMPSSEVPASWMERHAERRTASTPNFPAVTQAWRDPAAASIRIAAASIRIAAASIRMAAALFDFARFVRPSGWGPARGAVGNIEGFQAVLATTLVRGMVLAHPARR